MRLGLTGRPVLLPREKKQDYDAFSQEIFDELKPASPVEREKGATGRGPQWRLRRAAAMENALMGMMDPEGPEEIEIDTDVVRQVATLQIYVQRIQRVLKDAEKQLEEMQRVRKFRENQQVASMMAVYALRKKQGGAVGSARRWVRLFTGTIPGPYEAPGDRPVGAPGREIRLG